ncbi:uncharacterized protein N7498_007315, partial [Penicillium cinerascens]
MSSILPILTPAQLRFFLICNRFIQYCSAVVVVGINSYFINTGKRGLFTTYVEIISVISLAAFLPALVTIFMTTPVKEYILFIDVIFSYLWLTAFIFSALDYNKHNCHFSTPSGVACSKKWAIEAFIWLTFFFEVYLLFSRSLKKHFHSGFIDGVTKSLNRYEKSINHHLLSTMAMCQPRNAP